MTLSCGRTHPRHPEHPCRLPVGHDGSHDHTSRGFRIHWTDDHGIRRVGDRDDASPVNARRIVLETRGGTLRLVDLAPGDACAACGAGMSAHQHRDVGPAHRDVGPALIGIEFEGTRGPADGATLKTAICADCVSEALAILFGRRHVQTGGDVGDLRS